MEEYFYEAKVKQNLYSPTSAKPKNLYWTKPHLRRQHMYKGAMARMQNHHNFAG